MKCGDTKAWSSADGKYMALDTITEKAFLNDSTVNKSCGISCSKSENTLLTTADSSN